MNGAVAGDITSDPDICSCLPEVTSSTNMPSLPDSARAAYSLGGDNTFLMSAGTDPCNGMSPRGDLGGLYGRVRVTYQ